MDLQTHITDELWPARDQPGGSANLFSDGIPFRTEPPRDEFDGWVTDPRQLGRPPASTTTSIRNVLTLKGWIWPSLWVENGWTPTLSTRVGSAAMSQSTYFVDYVCLQIHGLQWQAGRLRSGHLVLPVMLVNADKLLGPSFRGLRCSCATNVWSPSDMWQYRTMFRRGAEWCEQHNCARASRGSWLFLFW